MSYDNILDLRLLFLDLLIGQMTLQHVTDTDVPEPDFTRHARFLEELRVPLKLHRSIHLAPLAPLVHIALKDVIFLVLAIRYLPEKAPSIRLVRIQLVSHGLQIVHHGGRGIVPPYGPKGAVTYILCCMTLLTDEHNDTVIDISRIRIIDHMHQVALPNLRDVDAPFHRLQELAELLQFHRRIELLEMHTAFIDTILDVRDP